MSSYQKRDGNACVVSMVPSPGIDVPQRKLLCKTRVQSVMMSCGIGPPRSAITLAVSFVFPNNISRSALLVIFYYLSLLYVSRVFPLQSLIELTEE